MTKKRFTTVYNEQSKMMQYVDNCKEEPNRWAIWNASETAQKLNKLNNENEQLKSRVHYLERKVQRERNATNKQYEKWEKEALEKINKLEKENAFLAVEVEALRQIKPIRKLPQELTVLKLDDGDKRMTTKRLTKAIEDEAEYWRKIAIELIWHYENKEKWKKMYNHYDRVENGDVE